MPYRAKCPNGPRFQASEQDNLDTKQWTKDDFSCDNAIVYILKSFSEHDLQKSIKYGIWSSTYATNQVLDEAYESAQKERIRKPVLLFFSVCGSKHFCGIAEMKSRVDFRKTFKYWSKPKYNASFEVVWHCVKDVPNHILKGVKFRTRAADNQSIVACRDGQVVPLKYAQEFIALFINYPSSTSLLQDMEHYDKLQPLNHLSIDELFDIQNEDTTTI